MLVFDLDNGSEVAEYVDTSIGGVCNTSAIQFPFEGVRRSMFRCAKKVTKELCRDCVMIAID